MESGIINNKLKFFSLIMATAVVLNVQEANAMTGTGTSIDPYVITSSQDMYDVRNNLAAYYKLDADIDLSSGYTGAPNWTPIGSYFTIASAAGQIADGDTATSFTGSFDGGNHTISNLFIDCTSKNSVDCYSQGLFGFTYTDMSPSGAVASIIKDIKFTNAHVTGDAYVGVLAGNIYYTTVENITVSNSTINGNWYVGAVTGEASKANITSACVNSGVTVNATFSKVGGISGVLTGKDDGSMRASLSNSFSCATVSSQGIPEYAGIGPGSIAGGLTGYAFEADISNSYNCGAVSATSTYISPSGITVGGLIGNAYGVTLSNAYNTGAVDTNNTDAAIGGVMGSVASANTAPGLTDSMTEVYNTGAVTAPAGAFAGAIYGSYGIVNGTSAFDTAAVYFDNITSLVTDAYPTSTLSPTTDKIFALDTPSMTTNATADMGLSFGTNWEPSMVAGKHYLPQLSFFAKNSDPAVVAMSRTSVGMPTAPATTSAVPNDKLWAMITLFALCGLVITLKQSKKHI